MSLPKNVLITGASSEIGFALTQKILLQGHKVFAQVHSQPQSLKSLSENKHLTILQRELSTSDQVQDLIEEVLSLESRLDVLVNSIGPYKSVPLPEISVQDWNQQIHLNLNLAFYLSLYAQNSLIQSKGHIINFSFSGAEHLVARIDSTAYCVAKAGINILTRSLASSLAPMGVRVNAIAPGLIEADSPETEERKEMLQKIPLGRAGKPEEVAEILTWLIQESPSYLTGAIIPIAGAWEYL